MARLESWLRANFTRKEAVLAWKGGSARLESAHLESWLAARELARTQLATR